MLRSKNQITSMNGWSLIVLGSRSVVNYQPFKEIRAGSSFQYGSRAESAVSRLESDRA
jgi:hypothetical protein